MARYMLSDMSRIGLGPEGAPPGSLPAEEQLRLNVKALLKQRRWDQADLAKRLSRSQSWVSKRLSGKPQPHGSRFQFDDLDALARVFAVPAAALLAPGSEYRERRVRDRRFSHDRRRENFAAPETDELAVPYDVSTSTTQLPPAEARSYDGSAASRRVPLFGERPQLTAADLLAQLATVTELLSLFAENLGRQATGTRGPEPEDAGSD